MIILGPGSEAARGGQVNPWFAIFIGASVLTAAWTKYLRGELREGAHIGILLGISAICAVFIAIGLWGLLH